LAVVIGAVVLAIPRMRAAHPVPAHVG
jgi:hypothetical protein